MDQIDRMELADLGNSLAIANAVLKQIGEVAIPVPITEIAIASGITEIKALELKGFEGALITPDHKAEGVILINKQSRSQRQRFTIGHELGHFLNFWHKPPPDGFKCTTSDMRTRSDAGAGTRLRMEAEANEFSAEVLMPRKQFVQDLRKIRSPGLDHIIDLASRYDTSELATTRRFVDLQDERSAYVLSKDGVVEHCHRHKSFPYIDLMSGQQVSRRSATATFSGTKDRCSKMDSVEPSLWVSQELPRGAEMFEQVLVQSGGYRITLLSIDESECEDEDEEYERERSERRPQFR